MKNFRSTWQSKDFIFQHAGMSFWSDIQKNIGGQVKGIEAQLAVKEHITKRKIELNALHRVAIGL